MTIIQDRRALHQIPELGRDLPGTIAYVKTALAETGAAVFSPSKGALCAWFDFGADSAIAFRADMDALPIPERSDKCWASRHPGKMHACGHDGHTAILLELARKLSREEALPHNVLLVFQPAEESGGGAEDICKAGVLREYGVKAIFGLHLWPGLEKGVVFSRCGELMARATEVNVDITGRSAHIAKSWMGLDALAAGMEYLRRVAELEGALPDNIFRLLKFGKFNSGTVRNAVSDHTRIEGSLRAFQDEIYDLLYNGVLTIGAEVEAATGCKVELSFASGYPAVMNPQPLYDQVRQALSFRELEEPCMTAEDFAFYQRCIPGMFFFLGLGDCPALHSDNFDFDETILEKGADFFLELARKFQ